METLTAPALRRIVLEQSKRANVGHIGSALSVVDIVCALYDQVLRIPEPTDPDRDRFVMSKGHAVLALYGALHLRGWISAEDLETYAGDGTLLGMHPEHRVPGIDFSTGSLGHGLSMGVGAALAARLEGSRRRVFVLLSDAECNEGSLWEAAMFAAHHRLSNLVAVIDMNGQQALGYTRDVLDLSQMADRWRAFGWDAQDVDGHDIQQMVRAMEPVKDDDGPPRVLVAETVFGRGVPFMEKQLLLALSPDVRRAVCVGVGGRGGSTRLRRSFSSTLAEIAATDDRIVLLTGDLGYMALEPFAETFPDRFVNVGVAEQNMVAMATGLAEAGFIPYCYSIGTFASLRAYEMIRNGPIAQRLPVRIVGVGGGFEYGHNGVSHYPIEDVGLMRIQPGMAVVTLLTTARREPLFSRRGTCRDPSITGSGRTTTPSWKGLEGRFELGKVDVVRTGSEVVLLAMGAAALDAVDAATRLEADGIAASVAVVGALNPAPVDDLRAILSRHSLAVSVEAHYVNGALGSLAAEVIAEAGLNCRLVRCGVEQTPDGRSGSQTYLHALHGIGAEQVGDRVIAALS